MPYRLLKQAPLLNLKMQTETSPFFTPVSKASFASFCGLKSKSCYRSFIAEGSCLVPVE
ncbi:MAG: hypothetical protein SVR08_01335 [Spirochaetota bacterium]|nr:hypothetical protein [Spirochaetota bacterium]